MVTSAPKRKTNRNTSRGKVFGLVLRQLRLAQDVSQEELAHRSGFHRTYIGMLERGERSPSIDTIFDLADTLRVRPSEIIAEVERAYRKRN